MVSDYVRRYYLENFKSRDTLFGCRQSWWCKQCSVAFTARVEELPCLQYNRVSLLLQKFLASVDSYANSKFFYTVFAKEWETQRVRLEIDLLRNAKWLPNSYGFVVLCHLCRQGSQGKFLQLCSWGYYFLISVDKKKLLFVHF